MNNPTCAQCDCVAGCQANPKACPNLEQQGRKKLLTENELLDYLRQSLQFAIAQPKDKP